ncbi:MAG: TIGR03936 family radical SAM-associated protein [Eubacteriales bacterium]|nr:TIGR03936 family radical SAM-associated protein [Eubacteriales bacterium]
MDKLRLRFKKTGRAIYISHLDLMHTMQRGFSRAGYELRYSEGFNPHPLISILLPLSVGASSVCELMDFRLKRDCDLTALPAELTAVLPEGLEIIEAYEPQRKSAELKWLQVEGVFEYDERPADKMAELLKEFYSGKEIVISKRTKRGMGESNIAEAIRSIDFTQDGNDVKISAVISAQEPTLNPELLAEALRQLLPEAAPDFAKFTRIETFDANMEIYR